MRRYRTPVPLSQTTTFLLSMLNDSELILSNCSDSKLVVCSSSKNFASTGDASE